MCVFRDKMRIRRDILFISCCLFYILAITDVVVGDSCPSNVTPVPICSSLSQYSSNTVYLSGFNSGSGDHRCQCSLSVDTFRVDVDDRTLIEIEDKTGTNPTPCDYSLNISLPNNTERLVYDCKSTTTEINQFYLREGETVQLLLKNGTFNAAGFNFCLRFSSQTSGYKLKLDCSKNSAPPGTTSTTTSTTPSTTTSATTVAFMFTGTSTTQMMRSQDVTTLVTEDDNKSVPQTITSTKPCMTDTSHNRTESEVDIVPWILFGLSLMVNLAVVLCCVSRRLKYTGCQHRQKKEADTITSVHQHINQTSPGNQASSPGNQTATPGNQTPSNSSQASPPGNPYETLTADTPTYYTSLKLTEESDYVNQKN